MKMLEILVDVGISAGSECVDVGARSRVSVGVTPDVRPTVGVGEGERRGVGVAGCNVSVGAGTGVARVGSSKNGGQSSLEARVKHPTTPATTMPTIAIVIVANMPYLLLLQPLKNHSIGRN